MFFSSISSSPFGFCCLGIGSPLNIPGWPELVQPSWCCLLKDGVTAMCHPFLTVKYSSSPFKSHPRKPYKKQITMVHCYCELLRVDHRDAGGCRSSLLQLVAAADCLRTLKTGKLVCCVIEPGIREGGKSQGPRYSLEKTLCHFSTAETNRHDRGRGLHKIKHWTWWGLWFRRPRIMMAEHSYSARESWELASWCVSKR